jgi:hypothetical protein
MNVRSSFLFALLAILFICVNTNPLEDDDNDNDSDTNKPSSLREMRKLLLTKENIVEHMARQQKDILVKNIPEPLVVKTSLDFSANSGEPGKPGKLESLSESR